MHLQPPAIQEWEAVPKEQRHWDRGIRKARLRSSLRCSFKVNCPVDFYTFWAEMNVLKL